MITPFRRLPLGNVMTHIPIKKLGERTASAAQPENVSNPIIVTLAGIAMLVRAVLWNAWVPITASVEAPSNVTVYSYTHSQ